METRPIKNEFWNWLNSDIKSEVERRSFPFAVLMFQILGDFNIGTVYRNANAFGCVDVYYYGKKKIDRRGMVGAYHYININYLKTKEELLELKKKYTFVAVENNVNGCVDINNFKYPKQPLFLFGEEGGGIPREFLDICDHIIEIKLFGTMRSINVGTCSGIIMNDYVSKLQKG